MLSKMLIFYASWLHLLLSMREWQRPWLTESYWHCWSPHRRTRRHGTLPTKVGSPFGFFFIIGFLFIYCLLTDWLKTFTLVDCWQTFCLTHQTTVNCGREQRTISYYDVLWKSLFLLLQVWNTPVKRSLSIWSHFLLKI